MSLAFRVSALTARLLTPLPPSALATQGQYIRARQKALTLKTTTAAILYKEVSFQPYSSQMFISYKEISLKHPLFAGENWFRVGFEPMSPAFRASVLISYNVFMHFCH